MRRARGAVLLVAVALLWPLVAGADANIVVDGSFSDWPADYWGFFDAAGDNPPPYADVQALRVTNDNSSGSDGNLFVAVDFFNIFRPTIGGHDVDVWLYLDIDGDGLVSGPLDRAIELTEHQIFDGGGNLLSTASTVAWSGDRLEAGIPYAALGLTHGSDVFGLSFAVTGHPNNVEYAPEPGTVNNGLITYDGTQGDGIEPLAVDLLALRAVSGPAGVELAWATASERRNAGFHVSRVGVDGRRVRLTAELVPGLVDTPVGQLYRLLDPSGRLGDRYLLEDVDVAGRSRRHPLIRASAFGPALESPRSGFCWEVPRPPRAGRARLKVGEAAQLAVRRPGLQRLTGADLSALGLSAQGTALSREARAVPVLPDGDGLLFVGVPFRDRHAEMEVVRAQAGRPRPMAARAVDGACAAPVLVLREETWLEQEREYFVASPVEDPFYWGSAFPGAPLSLEFDLPGLVRGDGALTLRLVGLGAGDHRVELALGPCALGEATFRGAGLAEVSLPVPGECLVERGNSLTVTLPAEVAWDGVFVDGLGVERLRVLRPEGGALELSAAPGACLEIRGLASHARLLDVTDPLQPMELRGARLATAGDGTMSLRFLDPGDPQSAPRRYLVVEGGQAAAVELLAPAAACTLGAAGVGADYLIITHPDFLAAARRLADLHAARGLSTRVVTTREAYDCYAFGRPGPDGIRALLDVALTSWTPRPRFALLLGGATVDPRGFLAGSPPDFLPAPFARLGAFGYEAATDAWYAAGPDAIPRLALGRLPVQSAAEADAVVDKIARALSGMTPSARWALAADDREPETGERTGLFVAQAWELWQECGPPSVEPVRLFKSELDAPQAALEAEAGIGLDALLYFGHAFLSGWSSGPTMADLALAGRLDNKRPFLLFSFTCFDGAFVGPWAESLAWAFVRNPEGGALAATASTTLGDPTALRRLSLALACGIRGGGRGATLGEILRAVQANLVQGSPAEHDMARAYHLLGDPATPLPGGGPTSR